MEKLQQLFRQYTGREAESYQQLTADGSPRRYYRFIADELSLDRRYLVRLFKEKTGMGIQEYIIQVRMEHARTLLQSGFSVNTTASMVGYHDSFNFSKMFKKTTGTSPKQFAQAHRLSEKKG